MTTVGEICRQYPDGFAKLTLLQLSKLFKLLDRKQILLLDALPSATTTVTSSLDDPGALKSSPNSLIAQLDDHNISSSLGDDVQAIFHTDQPTAAQIVNELTQQPLVTPKPNKPATHSAADRRSLSSSPDSSAGSSPPMRLSSPAATISPSPAAPTQGHISGRSFQLELLLRRIKANTSLLKQRVVVVTPPISNATTITPAPVLYDFVLGSDLVNWLMQTRTCPSRKSAVSVCQSLLEARQIILHPNSTSENGSAPPFPPSVFSDSTQAEYTFPEAAPSHSRDGTPTHLVQPGGSGSVPTRGVSDGSHARSRSQSHSLDVSQAPALPFPYTAKNAQKREGLVNVYTVAPKAFVRVLVYFDLCELAVRASVCKAWKKATYSSFLFSQRFLKKFLASKPLPPAIRGKCWVFLTGAGDVSERKRVDALFAQLRDMRARGNGEGLSENEREIAKDIPRTSVSFLGEIPGGNSISNSSSPPHLLASSSPNSSSVLGGSGTISELDEGGTTAAGEGEKQLEAVLSAYSVLDPEIGYCQGMTFIVNIVHAVLEYSYHYQHLISIASSPNLLSAAVQPLGSTTSTTTATATTASSSSSPPRLPPSERVRARRSKQQEKDLFFIFYQLMRGSGAAPTDYFTSSASALQASASTSSLSSLTSAPSSSSSSSLSSSPPPPASASASPAKKKGWNLRSLFQPKLPGLRYCLALLSHLIAVFLPELHQYFQKQDVQTEMFATSWFLTLFSSVLPTENANWVIDLFLERRWAILFQISLSVLAGLQPIVLHQLEGPTEVLSFLSQVQHSSHRSAGARRAASMSMRRRASSQQLQNKSKIGAIGSGGGDDELDEVLASSELIHRALGFDVEPAIIEYQQLQSQPQQPPPPQQLTLPQPSPSTRLPSSGLRASPSTPAFSSFSAFSSTFAAAFRSSSSSSNSNSTTTTASSANSVQPAALSARGAGKSLVDSTANSNSNSNLNGNSTGCRNNNNNNNNQNQSSSSPAANNNNNSNTSTKSASSLLRSFTTLGTTKNAHKGGGEMAAVVKHNDDDNTTTTTTTTTTNSGGSNHSNKTGKRNSKNGRRSRTNSTNNSSDDPSPAISSNNSSGNSSLGSPTRKNRTANGNRLSPQRRRALAAKNGGSSNDSNDGTNPKSSTNLFANFSYDDLTHSKK